MANTITVSLQLSVALGTGGSVSGVGSQSLTQAGSFSEGYIATVTTSAATLSVGGVTAPCLVMIKNLDPTNYIEVDNVTGINAWPQKILPGAFILVSPEAMTIYAKANTASCNVLVVLIDL